MSIIKRGETQWYEFVYKGQRVRESTHQANREVARNMQAEHRARLVREEREREDWSAKLGCAPDELRNCSECALPFDGRNPIMSPDGERSFCCENCERKWQSRQAPTPTFPAFADRFRQEMKSRHSKKPKTATYYCNSLDRLLEFVPFQSARLDRIDEQMVSDYILKRKQTKAKRKDSFVKTATLNRELEVLRRLLRVAAEWKIIQRVPKISRQPGEEGRELVVTHAAEQSYLAVAKQPLRDIATAICDQGWRPEETFRFSWPNVHFKAAANARFGYIFNEHGKVKNARRAVPMTQRVAALLHMRWEKQGRPKDGFVFPADTKSGHIDSVKSQHGRAIKDSGLAHFVLYSFRHTALTRLGESGCDAFTIMKVAGHASISTSAKYVHPSDERAELAFAKLADYNARKMEELRLEQEREAVQ